MTRKTFVKPNEIKNKSHKSVFRKDVSNKFVFLSFKFIHTYTYLYFNIQTKKHDKNQGDQSYSRA